MRPDDGTPGTARRDGPALRGGPTSETSALVASAVVVVYGVVVLTVEGPLGDGGYRTCRTALDLVVARQTRAVVVDLRRVDVNEATAGVCEALRAYLERSAVTLWLAEAPFLLARALRGSGLHRGYRWAPTAEIAVERVTARTPVFDPAHPFALSRPSDPRRPFDPGRTTPCSP